MIIHNAIKFVIEIKKNINVENQKRRKSSDTHLHNIAVD